MNIYIKDCAVRLNCSAAHWSYGLDESDKLGHQGPRAAYSDSVGTDGAITVQNAAPKVWMKGDKRREMTHHRRKK